MHLILALRLASREFRAGFRGFWIFLACIALGVTAIIGIGSLTLALKDGLAAQGRAIVGGDASFILNQRQVSPAEKTFLLSQGRVSTIAQLRAMARRDDGEAALVEIKAVDDAYPLAGEVITEPPQPLAGTLAERNGAFGLIADAGLFGRLNLNIGDRIRINAADFELRSTLVSEPDRLASGFGFGPHVLMSRQALAATGLVQPGSLIKWLYRVALEGPPASDERVTQLIEMTNQKFPEAGWDVRARDKVSPQFSRNLDRFSEFLTLTGLTALIVGGVGVANAVRGFVERKQKTLAILKSLGADGTAVFILLLMQTLVVATAGIIIGALAGVLLPFALISAFSSILAFPLAPAIHPAVIAKGALYGFLISLTFSILPLGRAHDVPVQALFRAVAEPSKVRPRGRYLVATGASALCLVAVVFGFASDARIVSIYFGVTAGAFAFLRGAALLIASGARRLPHARNVALRLAIANIHRPGSPTPSIVLSLGLGLTLLAALMLIDGNVRAELAPAASQKTPGFFFLDVQSAQANAFADFLAKEVPGGSVELVPMLRGRIVKLNGQPPAPPKPSVAWVLEGDRGLTIADAVPQGSVLTKGAWWPKAYEGPPLVSMDEEIASGLGLNLGDTVTVNVLGRDITATIANMRHVNWRSYGINFVLVLSPNTLAGAPLSEIATVTFPGAPDLSKEARLVREVAARFPQITVVRVKDALDMANHLIDELANAITGAASFAFLASILVLGGALAAGQEARIHDAAVLKTLGATRASLLTSYIYEFGLLGLCITCFGIAAGSGAALAIVQGVMGLDYLWLWGRALAAAAGALIATIALGLSSTYWILGQKPAAYLREL